MPGNLNHSVGPAPAARAVVKRCQGWTTPPAGMAAVDPTLEFRDQPLLIALEGVRADHEQPQNLPGAQVVLASADNDLLFG